jgi:hypothetical protein
VNILFTAVGNFLTVEAQACLTEWRASYHAVEQMPMERVAAYLRLDRASTLALVDAIVCMADSDTVISEGYRPPALDFPLQKALALAGDVRGLPGACTMRDGRKWNSIPFVIFCGRWDSGTVLARRQSDALVYPFPGPLEALMTIQTVFDDYQDKVLADYESLGILVRVSEGRVQIGPALRLRKERAESAYYYAAGDRRRHTGLVTVKRDSEGLRRDVEMFQYLLERKSSESEMHRFFEEHPAILMQARMGIPISHAPRFANPKDNTPDFAFSPILGPWDAKAIELMELKGPAEATLRKGPHPGFTAKVMKAVDQIRDYARYLPNPDNLDAVLRALGYLPDYSKLAVLIGREPKSEEERAVWAQRQSELNVKVVTYDEILATQEAQLKKRPSPYRLRYGTPDYPLE